MEPSANGHASAAGDGGLVWLRNGNGGSRSEAGTPDAEPWSPPDSPTASPGLAGSAPAAEPAPTFGRPIRRRPDLHSDEFYAAEYTRLLDGFAGDFARVVGDGVTQDGARYFLESRRAAAEDPTDDLECDLCDVLALLKLHCGRVAVRAEDNDLNPAVRAMFVHELPVSARTYFDGARTMVAVRQSRRQRPTGPTGKRSRAR